jgi:hypothetical protein
VLHVEGPIVEVLVKFMKPGEKAGQAHAGTNDIH